MFVVIAYDIADARRLQRVAKITCDYAVRVQKSIFEMDCPPDTLRLLKSRIESVLDMEQDGVKFFALCERCAQKATVIGVQAEGLPDVPYVVL
jgi:CRISPR-associated protein Cas2